MLTASELLAMLTVMTPESLWSTKHELKHGAKAIITLSTIAARMEGDELTWGSADDFATDEDILDYLDWGISEVRSGPIENSVYGAEVKTFLLELVKAVVGVGGKFNIHKVFHCAADAGKSEAILLLMAVYLDGRAVMIDFCSYFNAGAISLTPEVEGKLMAIPTFFTAAKNLIAISEDAGTPTGELHIAVCESAINHWMDAPMSQIVGNL